MDSVKQFLSETSSGDANLSQFFDDGTIKVESKGEMETIVFPKGNTSDSGNTFGSEINCTKNIEDKDKRTNRG